MRYIIEIDTQLKPDNVWSLVEEFYPNYDSSDNIALADDLHKILEGEITGNAEKLWEKEYECNKA